jgi:hypothetical protein
VLLQARYLADRVTQEAGTADAPAQVRTLYRIALSREPTPAEMKGQLEFIRNQREFHKDRSGSSASDRSPEVAALTDLTHVMLNANEFVYIN